MCGITAFYMREASISKHVIKSAWLQSLKRGTDGFGAVLIRGQHQPGVCYKTSDVTECTTILHNLPHPSYPMDVFQKGDVILSNARAAPETECGVSNVERNVQPICNREHGLYLVHNGAVSSIIQKELKESGFEYEYQTDIDSEAIIHAYLMFGRNMNDTMNYLSGGFAFVLVDTQKNCMYLVCTHSPLYCGYLRGWGFFAASTEESIWETISLLKGQKIEKNTMALWEDYYAHRVPEYSITSIDLDSGMVSGSSFEPRYITSTYDVYKKDKTKPKRECVLVAASGGLDSSTTLATLKAAEMNPIAVHFKYGHRGQDCERAAIGHVTKALGIELREFDISDAMSKLDFGMLTDPKAKIITGTEEGLKTTAAWTTFRNHLMLVHMGALAESLIMTNQYDDVYLTGGFLQLTESGCIVNHINNRILRYDGKEVLPNDLNVGDEIMSFNIDKGLLEKSIIKEKFNNHHQDTYKLTFTYNSGCIQSEKILFVSGTHPFFIKGKNWVEANALFVGDVCYSIKECKLKDNIKRGNAFPGYDFEKRSKCRMGHSVSAETRQKLSSWRTGKKMLPEIKEKIRKAFLGDKNPMFGHIRSNTIPCWCGKTHQTGDTENRKISSKKCWKDEEYRRRILNGLSIFWSSEEGENVKQILSEKMKQVYKERLIANGGIHWNQTPEGREKCRQATLKMIAEGKINPSICGCESPNKKEKELILLFESHSLPLRFVGDGQIWITSSGKHMNPDFINIEQKKIVEYYGGIGYFHTLEEIENRHQLYKKMGWDHLAILETDDPNLIVSRVTNFLYSLQNGWNLERIEIINGEQEMINYYCEPNNNFFVNKLLTHNSYPDNCERFVDAAIKFFKFSIAGLHIKPLYGLCNILKTEQYHLLNQLGFLKPLEKFLVSCDRPMMIQQELKNLDGKVCGCVSVPANCSKDGKPACGSGLLSYWSCKMAGLEDGRTYYVVDDSNYVAYEPPSLDVKTLDILNIINRLEIPEKNKEILRKRIGK
jgi:hypothetical protein